MNNHRPLTKFMDLAPGLYRARYDGIVGTVTGHSKVSPDHQFSFVGDGFVRINILYMIVEADNVNPGDNLAIELTPAVERTSRLRGQEGRPFTVRKAIIRRAP